MCLIVIGRIYFDKEVLFKILFNCKRCLLREVNFFEIVFILGIEKVFCR